MPRRSVVFHPGEYYHVYNRGVNRERTFFETENYAFFLRKLREFLFDDPPSGTATPVEQRPVSVIAYCLMPNHYHLLVQLHEVGFSKRMQSFSQAYTNAMNKERCRVGPLFQGRFKAIHVERDEYLLHLTRYIHRNPVVANMVAKPEDWPFSSYLDFIGLRSGTIPEGQGKRLWFPSPAAYRRFVESAEDETPIANYVFDE